ncbi:Cytochrome P450 3A13, partial [Fragariocoptes setiger]
MLKKYEPDDRKPSVTQVLTDTMPAMSVYILNKWKNEMIEKLGKEGFKKYQDATFKRGRHLYSYERVLQRHDELGPTFGACYGADAWIFTKDPDIIQHIFITQGHIHTDSNRLNLPIPELNNSVAQATGDRWKRLRSAIGQAFTHGRMKSDSVFSDIQSVTSIAVETIGMIPSNRRDGVNYRIADIRDLSKRFSCEVMLRIGFATNNRIDFHSASDPLIDSIDEAGTQLNNPITWMSNIFPSLTSFACRLSKLVPIYRNISYIFNVLQTNAMERANSIHNSIDKNYDRKMIDSFMESYCRKEITYEEFKGTGIYFILAGYYPTANAITCLCWLLARHQRVQEKLRSYLLQFGGVSQTLKDNYLDQVIFETCRLYPPMPSFVGRKLQHDVRIKGMTLPRGACIIPSTLAVHHDKTLWGPDASEFRPERFENAKNYHAAQFLPFSLGSRSCAGNRMAMSVIRTFISQIILQYKLDIASSTCLELRFQSPNPIQLMIEKPILIKFVNLSQADPSFDGKPAIIDFKPANKAKPLYDYPLQLSAYAGAINFDERVKLSTNIDTSIVIVAYTDGSPATLHTFDAIKHWCKWLERIDQFYRMKSYMKMRDSDTVPRKKRKT